MSTKREYRNNEGTTKHKKRTEESFRDWICLSCTNLNYFFRKKCNRCKLQTKELNEKGVLAVYQCYEPYYVYDYPSTQSVPLLEETSLTVDPISTPRKSRKNSSEDQDTAHSEANSEELPSVSPLVKKYNASKQRDERSAVCSSEHSIFCCESWDQIYEQQQDPASEGEQAEVEDAGLLRALSLMI